MTDKETTPFEFRQPGEQVLLVTAEGEFIWHKDAESMIKNGDFSSSPSLRFVLQRLWILITRRNNMTDKEAMQMALVQMGKNQWFVADMAKHVDVMAFNSAVEALRARLVQPEQEPVAILNHAHGVYAFRSVKIKHLPDGEYKLYTIPPAAQQRKPLRTVIYACPICAASLERKE